MWAGWHLMDPPYRRKPLRPSSAQWARKWEGRMDNRAPALLSCAATGWRIREFSYDYAWKLLLWGVWIGGGR